MLAPYVTLAKLPEQVITSTKAWQTRREDTISKILDRFGSAPLAVRSSAAHEDGEEYSFAGTYQSLTNVEPTPNALASAVDVVFGSYAQPSKADQVLVQPMVSGVIISGVVLTRDLDTGSPYYVISYDDFSGRTDTVTSGGESKTILVHRSCPDALHSSRFRKLIDCVIELEGITGSHELDIEFCITDEEKIFVLQVRPITARQHWDQLTDDVIDNALEDIRGRLSRLMAPAPGLFGRSTILGEMPDWNPAEMIGNTPRPLALSMYKHLITDHIWADARARMGYRHIQEPLLVDYCGRPFIDVRLSLNSFLPAGLEDGLAERIVDHQIDHLRNRPDLHDKIEFEIALTCRDFTFERGRKNLTEAGFDTAEIETFEGALAGVTRAALKNGLKNVEALVSQSNRLLAEEKEDHSDPLHRVQALLEDCKTLGTLPFSQLARHGFIGVLFLKSLVGRGVFTEDDAERFMQGIHTITADLVRDMHAVGTGGMGEEAFLRRYGHLRPATYDILSWRYDERPKLYLGGSCREPPSAENGFELSAKQRAGIELLLSEFGYQLSADELLAYIRAAIKGREQAKFAFTKSLSDALAVLAEWGEGMGLSRDDLSFLPIEAILVDSVESLKEKVNANQEAFKLTRALRLPHLIIEPDDIDVVGLPLGHPTFITSKKTTAKTLKLDRVKVENIDGRIVLIESADPGFDWIFSHPIEGLITKYGGPNSHMAIRCAEFRLPAAIGCGERLFNMLAEASVVELNCAARKLSVH